MIGSDRLIWVGAAAAVLLTAALLSIWLGRRHSRKVKIIWTVVAVLVPIIGPLGWFALGWERKR